MKITNQSDNPVNLAVRMGAEKQILAWMADYTGMSQTELLKRMIREHALKLCAERRKHALPLARGHFLDLIESELQNLERQDKAQATLRSQW